MPLTDTHCHLYADRFGADLPAVLDRARAAGVSRLLVPGVDQATSRRAIALARQNEPVYCAVGLHPTELTADWVLELEALQDLCAAEKVVAVGEIGLDYYRVADAHARRQQCSALQKQLELAQVTALPVILHLREQDDAEEGAAARDLLAILRTWTADLETQSPSLVGRAGVLHSFSGSLDTAQQAIALGCYIGVTGPVTYPNAHRRRAVVKDLPIERIVIETDSPFLAPQEQRGRRNEPAFVVHIADKIASIQSRTPTQVAEATCSSAARLFAWGEPQ